MKFYWECLVSFLCGIGLAYIISTKFNIEWHWEVPVGAFCGIILAYIIDTKFNRGRLTHIWKQLLFSKKKQKKKGGE